ncbi:hypothetical protein [Arthrobacter psychrolactophilus]
MGRQRAPKNVVVEPDVALKGPVAGMYTTDTGKAELVPDGDNPNGWLLMLNGVQSSHVDLADPLRLDFEYMRWIMALVQDPLDAGGEAAHAEPGRGRVLHAPLFSGGLPEFSQCGGRDRRQTGQLRP